MPARPLKYIILAAATSHTPEPRTVTGSHRTTLHPLQLKYAAPGAQTARFGTGVVDPGMNVGAGVGSGDEGDGVVGGAGTGAGEGVGGGFVVGNWFNAQFD
jgi:hypothetical protein